MRIVVKLAGALLENESTVRSIAPQIAELAGRHEVLVIHGGGRIFTATLAKMGVESRFFAGLRITDQETRDAAVMVFAGLLNKRVSAAISSAGRPAVGVCAADALCFQAERMTLDGAAADLGYVGYITGVNVGFLESLWREGIVPVAACLGAGEDGELFNVNADHMAAACAEFVGADTLIYLTDVEGVLDGAAVLPEVHLDDVEEMIRSHRVTGGMVLKLEACRRAMEGGVSEVRVVGGEAPGSLLAAMDGAACGTRILNGATAAPEPIAARFAAGGNA
ncbi:MAG TPA: acetylglutamate kinase [Candidatus Acidoferrales bacterium]|nr:acetylglutamate kinase [Candidatus Acidoferrales bacterium]